MHILIVDDEPLARNELAYLINQTSKDIMIFEADDGDSALDILETGNIDAIFLDIHLTSESGLDVADRVNKLIQPPDIIFATAFDDYAIKAFEKDALDYILKPFTLERVRQTISRLAVKSQHDLKVQKSSYSQSQSEFKRIPVEVDDRIIMLNISDILAIEVLKGQTTLYTLKDNFFDSRPLVQWEEKLSDFPFIRVHRSYLIQVDAIQEIQPWFNQTYQITLVNGMKIPVSRSYLKSFKEALGL